MVIRDVGGGRPGGAPSGRAGAVPKPLEQGLGEAGLLKGGASPQDAAAGLLGRLAKAGFNAPPGQALGAALATALKQFQAKQGLPPNGKLDTATAGALQTAGVLHQAEAQAPGREQKAARDGFEKNAPSLLKQGEQKRADMVNQGTPDTNFLDALINQLGTGGPNEGMSASDIKGAAAGAESKNVDAQQKLAEAKKGEGVNKKGSTAASDRDVATPSNQQLDRGNGQGVKVARGLRAETTKTDEKRRKDALTGQDPTEQGILDEEAEEDALEGAGDDGKKRRGKGGDQEQGGQDADGSTTGGSGVGVEAEASERDRGNASSGDERLHEERGHASTDDGSDAEAGFYRVPAMSEQCFAALERISKDAAVENRATTYSWDVTFYKPGTYGPGQKAQELVHLVVDKATAFDAVWTKAHANLTALVRRVDGDGAVPSLDDIVGAIRQARAREGDVSAAKVGKIHRPLGRA
ncbi:MAG: peptidoglycan-binding protein [Deltaproteobacteria bacterium]|nr:peptidoglycan-binding protein [Deltaproteobacteria bacterium]